MRAPWQSGNTEVNETVFFQDEMTRLANELAGQLLLLLHFHKPAIGIVGCPGLVYLVGEHRSRHIFQVDGFSSFNCNRHFQDMF